MEGSASARWNPAEQPRPNSCALSLSAASNAIETRMRLSRIRFSAEWFCERGLLTAVEVEPRQPPACAQLFQEIASWLSLATRSNASVELLMRYWQSSPSVG